MKTTAITSIIAALAALLLALFLSPATGNAGIADTSLPSGKSIAGEPPVEHVGMGENRPL